MGLFVIANEKKEKNKMAEEKIIMIKCTNCGGDKIIKGTIEGNSRLVFIPERTKNFGVCSSRISTYVCQSCGMVVKQFLENPERI